MEVTDSGPWDRLDPVKIQRQAELKETKLQRKQEQRLERARLRREKRHAKGEAKQARKANVKRAAKWNDDRKALDKIKKLANRPHKQEKRRRRMLQKAVKYEIQARKLMNDAQVLRARYKYLTDIKEKEDAEKNKTKRAVAALKADPERKEDFIPLDSDSISDVDPSTNLTPLETVNGHLTPKAKPDGVNGSHHSDGADEDLAPAEKVKKERKKDKKSKKSNTSKPSVDDEVAEAEVPAVEAPAVDSPAEPAESESKEDRKARKEAKKRKREEQQAADVDGEPADQAERKEKRKKKKAKSSEEGYVKNTPTLEDAQADQSGQERWNVSELAGGPKRQEKFLKLLGAKKKAASSDNSSSLAGIHKDRLNMIRVNDDLERQFDTGRRMKAEGRRHTRGLGA